MKTTANQIVDKLKAKKDASGNSKFPNAQVWVKGSFLRIYTGHGREYLKPVKGRFVVSKKIMKWHADIDDVLDAVGRFRTRHRQHGR